MISNKNLKANSTTQQYTSKQKKKKPIFVFT